MVIIAGDLPREMGNVETESIEIPLGYQMSELGIIPEDWEIKTILTFAPLQRGFDLPSAELKLGTYPVVYSNGIVNHHIVAKIKGPGVVTGRSGTIGKVHFIKKNYWPHNTTLWVTNFNGNNPKYTYYLYQYIGFERFSTGSGVPTLNRNDIHSFKISIPPAKEQEKIAAALSDIDLLVNSLDQLITKKRNIKLAAMQQLLTGKQRLPGFHDEWKKKQLGEIADCYSGGTPLTSNPHYYNGDIFWITSGDLNQRYIKNVKGKITTLGLNNSAAKIVKKGTLLIALYGATAGVTAITQIDAAINQAILAIIPKYDQVDFLFHYFELKKNWLINTYTQGGQPNLSGDIIKSIEFLIPTLEEQHAIADILSDMDTELSSLEQQLAKVRKLKQGMMQELLTGRIRLK